MIHSLLLDIADFCFGWLLWLPGDLPLIGAATLTSFVLVVVRKVASDQDFLRRRRNDRRRLKELRRQARTRGNREAAQRHRGLLCEVALRSARAEIRPLLPALAPLILIGIWCFERLPYYPPAVGENINVSLHQPLSASGRLVHLVPSELITTRDGWIKRLAQPTSASLSADATWSLKVIKWGQAQLVFRSGDRTFIHPFGAGRGARCKTTVVHSTSQDITSEISLRSRTIFGLAPSIPSAGIPDWLTGYLIMATILFLVMKRAFNIC